jgi:hypothetical protein
MCVLGCSCTHVKKFYERNWRMEVAFYREQVGEAHGAKVFMCNGTV